MITASSWLRWLFDTLRSPTETELLWTWQSYIMVAAWAEGAADRTDHTGEQQLPPANEKIK
jgi:hypothetical protein